MYRRLLYSSIIYLFQLCRMLESANILILHPIFSGSHDLVLRTVGEQLIDRGHNVTQIRFPQKHYKKAAPLNTRVNVLTLPIKDEGNTCSRYISAEGEFDINQLGNMIWNELDSPRHIPYDIYCSTHLHCKMLIQDKEIFNQLKAQHFDIAIVDLIANECGLALARALGLPVVTFWGFGYQGGEVMYTSNFNPASIVPAFMSGLDRNMNFLQKSMNLGLYYIHYVLQSWQGSIADIYIQESYPELIGSSHLVHNIDMALVNINFFVDYPRLLAPNTKYVGAMHIKRVTKLPKRFLDFVEGAEHGVVLFSLGFTGFLPKDIPRQVMDGFLDAFANIPQRVIMRFDPDVLSYIPDNVMVVDWMPQIDLLGHNNTVLFISHCGMNGVSESLFYRVPILGMPIFADQTDNAAKIKDRGIGLVLDRHNINAEEVLYNIKEITNNPKYKKKVDLYADLWREERFTPMEEAIYWIELLHKYGNFDHLRINDGDLSLIQYLCLDVIFFWGFFVLALLVTLAHFTRLLLRHLKTNVPMNDTPEKNNNHKKMK